MNTAVSESRRTTKRLVVNTTSLRRAVSTARPLELSPKLDWPNRALSHWLIQYRYQPDIVESYIKTFIKHLVAKLYVNKVRRPLLDTQCQQYRTHPNMSLTTAIAGVQSIFILFTIAVMCRYKLGPI